MEFIYFYYFFSTIFLFKISSKILLVLFTMIINRGNPLINPGDKIPRREEPASVPENKLREARVSSFNFSRVLKIILPNLEFILSNKISQHICIYIYILTSKNNKQ